MGLVREDLLRALPSAMLFMVASVICGSSSAVYLLGGPPAADRSALAAAELAIVFGLITLVTVCCWGGKAWGVWWVWDVRLHVHAFVDVALVVVFRVARRRFARPVTVSKRCRPASACSAWRSCRFVLVGESLAKTLSPEDQRGARRCRHGSGHSIVVVRVRICLSFYGVVTSARVHADFSCVGQRDRLLGRARQLGLGQAGQVRLRARAAARPASRATPMARSTPSSRRGCARACPPSPRAPARDPARRAWGCAS